LVAFQLVQIFEGGEVRRGKSLRAKGDCIPCKTFSRRVRLLLMYDDETHCVLAKQTRRRIIRRIPVAVVLSEILLLFLHSREIPTTTPPIVLSRPAAATAPGVIISTDIRRGAGLICM